jgi:hypothetical protein
MCSPQLVASLGASADVDPSSFVGYLEAFRVRCRAFIEHGATSTDHSHADTRTDPARALEAERIHHLALRGQATEQQVTAYRRNLVFEMARRSTEDGLTMILHPGVRRNHHRPTFGRFGGDTGHDRPFEGEFTDGLRSLLEAFGTARTSPWCCSPSTRPPGPTSPSRVGVPTVPCDNLSENGAVIAGVTRSVAERVDPSLLDRLEAYTSFVTTMVDRIMPATTDEDRATVVRATGWPAWETAGATFAPEIGPFERRKLTLLNGAHSLLTDAGPSRGHGTVAVTDHARSLGTR